MNRTNLEAVTDAVAVAFVSVQYAIDGKLPASALADVAPLLVAALTILEADGKRSLEARGRKSIARANIAHYRSRAVAARNNASAPQAPKGDA